MSTFLVDLDGGKVPVSDGDEYAENTYDWVIYPAQMCSHVIGLDSSKRLRRIPMTLFPSVRSKVTGVYSITDPAYTIIIPSALGDVDLRATREWRLGSSASYRPTAIKIWSQGVFNIKPSVALFESHVRTNPSLGGFSMYADSFIVWCSKEGKEEIGDIVEPEKLFKKISPKQYKVKGKLQYGPLAENSPPEVYEETQAIESENIPKAKGVSFSKAFWLLYDVVLRLVKRVEDLESAKEA